MISQTAQYALRAIVCLAARPHISLTTAQLAEITMVPSKYLSKVMSTFMTYAPEQEKWANVLMEYPLRGSLTIGDVVMFNEFEKTED